MAQDITFIRIRCNGKVRDFVGRLAWTLARLIAAGDVGCTPYEHPAPRWGHYTYRLRREGVAIETITEKHGGTYAGHHARYVLRSAIEVIEIGEGASARGQRRKTLADG